MRPLRFTITLAAASLAILLPLAVLSCKSSSDPIAEPHVVAKSREETGKYLILSAGCNDCHTDGWKKNDAIPEDKWLTGSPVGWRGPWGTTYAPNLRLTLIPYTEESFIKVMRGRDTKPPMPWRSLHAMSDPDLGSILLYIKSLGPAGEMTPHDLPPGKDPETPYVSSFVINGKLPAPQPATIPK